MSYNIKTIPHFDKALKRLSKKYPSLKKEYIAFLYNLEENPVQGMPIGNNCYKIRFAIASKGKGKRGGTRIITHVLAEHTTLYLLDIYDKSEQNSISDRELKVLLEEIR
jgi:mRNA-degrading endonuclease RelE of RelBE toxin-antitoxin system